MGKKKKKHAQDEINSWEDEPIVFTAPIPLEQEERPKFLTKEEYLEWSLTIEQWNVAKEKSFSAALKLDLMKLKLENESMKTDVYKHTVLAKAQQIEVAHKNEYERFMTELENKKGFALKDKMIDPFTFEVKELPKN